MALSIKNPEVERLAREIAQRRHISVTEAIRQSLEREAKAADEERAARLKRMIAIAESAAAVPRISDMTDDEILGYDEFGIPSR